MLFCATVKPVRVALVESEGYLRLVTNERSSTALRFASFLARLWAWAAAVKGRDERTSGALDRARCARRDVVCRLLLDRGDALIDGLPSVTVKQQHLESPRV
jgi:hypothetical protein